MKCVNCGSEDFTEGTLEGISFLPASEGRKFIGKGIYGVQARLCLGCGNIDRIWIDKNVLASAKGIRGQRD